MSRANVLFVANELISQLHTWAHPGVSPQEPVGQRHAQVEVDHVQYPHLHLQQLSERVRAVADVQEVVHLRGDALLWGVALVGMGNC